MPFPRIQERIRKTLVLRFRPKIRTKRILLLLKTIRERPRKRIPMKKRNPSANRP